MTLSNLESNLRSSNFWVSLVIHLQTSNPVWSITSMRRKDLQVLIVTNPSDSLLPRLIDTIRRRSDTPRLKAPTRNLLLRISLRNRLSLNRYRLWTCLQTSQHSQSKSRWKSVQWGLIQRRSWENLFINVRGILSVSKQPAGSWLLKKEWKSWKSNSMRSSLQLTMGLSSTPSWNP